MYRCILLSLFFFFNDTATTEIYTLSLHDALPIWALVARRRAARRRGASDRDRPPSRLRRRARSVVRRAPPRLPGSRRGELRAARDRAPHAHWAAVPWRAGASEGTRAPPERGGPDGGDHPPLTC